MRVPCASFLAGLTVLSTGVSGAFAASITTSTAALVRTDGTTPRNLAPITAFDAAVDSTVPPGYMAVRTSLSDMVTGEGLVNGPAPGAFYSGSTVSFPAGITLSAVSGAPTLNSGLPLSTAVFVDLQGDVAGTDNLYHLGDVGEGATEPNRVQFYRTDVGTNADNIRVLRPVSFDNSGGAIEIQASPPERGVLEAGGFRFHLDPLLNIRGMKITFIDTETNAALNTGVFNIEVGGVPVPDLFHVPAGGNDNEYFVGFLGDGPVTAFDIELGWINAGQTGGDGVNLDMATIEFITTTEVPEPGTFGSLAMLSLAVLAAFRRGR